MWHVAPFKQLPTSLAILEGSSAFKERGVSWSRGALTGFFRSQEGWEPPGMHFTASKEWVSSWQSKCTSSLSFFILKKGELLSLQQVPSLLEKVVGTSEPFPLPTAVLLGCAGQRPLKSVFIFWFLCCCYFSSRKQTSQMLGPLHGASWAEWECAGLSRWVLRWEEREEFYRKVFFESSSVNGLQSLAAYKRRSIIWENGKWFLSVPAHLTS